MKHFAILAVLAALFTSALPAQITLSELIADSLSGRLTVCDAQLFAHAGVVRPAVIRDWRQVEPLVGINPKATIPLKQIRIDSAFITAWRTTTNTTGPGWFQIAITDQPNPVLITCWHAWQRCDLNPHKPWFETRADGALIQP
jgi:hypothetical protein